jgi:hypothetical protein
MDKKSAKVGNEEDVLATMKRLAPDKAKQLEQLKKGEAKLDDKPQAPPVSEKTVGDLNDVFRDLGAAPPKEEGADWGKEEQEQIARILNEITELNFVDIGYMEYFPLLPFDRRLELLGVDKEEGAKICDHILTKGFYTKSLKIRSLDLKLTTREAEHYLETIENLEKDRASRARVLEMMALYNMAGSLEQYGETMFAPLREIEDEEEREKYINAKIKFLKRLPTNVYQIIARETTKFDLLTSTITSEEGLLNL